MDFAALNPSYALSQLERIPNYRILGEAIMIIRQSSLAAFAGLMLGACPAVAQVSSASEACTARCEQQACQTARISKGECRLRCATRCKEVGSKKKKS